MSNEDLSAKSIPYTGEVAWADPTRMWRTRDNFISYNPSVLVTRKGLQVFDKMRQDDQIKSALMFKKHAILSTGWEIISPEGQDREWEVTEFVYWVLNNLEETLDEALLELLSALDYGFSISEKVWEKKKINLLGTEKNYVVLKTLKGRKPHGFDFEMDNYGNLKRLLQTQVSTIESLPINKFVLFTYEKEFGNWYGKSDLEAAYRPWWAKHNVYQWLVMYLERLGIPPVFALYDPNSYMPEQKNALKDIMVNMQAATFGILPRPTKPDVKGNDILDFWTPELASQAKDVFMPALDMFNHDIARAVLMPGLIGFTPDTREGSYARSKKHFDVFMMVVEYIRRKMEKRILCTQVIKELVDLNYTVNDYPIFRFLPMTDEIRADLLSTWIQSVEKGIVVPQTEDEIHIRSLLRFPEKDELVKTAMNNNVPNTTLNSNVNNNTTPQSLNKSVDTSTTPPTKYSDGISEISLMLVRTEDSFVKDMRSIIDKMQESLTVFVERNWDSRQKWVDDLKLKYLSDLQEFIREQIRFIYNKGEMSVEGLSSFSIDVLKIFTKKALIFSGDIRDRLLKECKVLLLNSISMNYTKEQTLPKLKDVFGYLKIESQSKMYARHIIIEGFNLGVVAKSKELGKDKILGLRYNSNPDTIPGSICSILNGKIFDLEDPDLMKFSPPNHHGCRSYWSPVFVDTPVGGDMITEAIKGQVKDVMPVNFGESI